MSSFVLSETAPISAIACSNSMPDEMMLFAASPVPATAAAMPRPALLNDEFNFSALRLIDSRLLRDLFDITEMLAPIPRTGFENRSTALMTASIVKRFAIAASGLGTLRSRCALELLSEPSVQQRLSVAPLVRRSGRLAQALLIATHL